MRGCNLVLWDNSPYLSYYSQAEETHCSLTGTVTPNHGLQTSNERVQK
jgi:hypothetical protein